MNKDEIINVLDKYSFDKNEIFIISGAALVLQEIIDSTSDIDLSVTSKYYNCLLDNYKCVFERTNEYSNDCYMIDNIINFGTSFLPEKYEVINGYKVASLEDCYKVKKLLNRDKDKEILKKIQKILER